MSNFNDNIQKLKSNLKSLLDNNSNTEFIEKIGSLDKQIDEVVNAHEETTKELQKTQESFIEYVKGSGFKSPSNEPDPTKVETPKSIEEIMNNCLDKYKEEK